MIKLYNLHELQQADHYERMAKKICAKIPVKEILAQKG